MRIITANCKKGVSGTDTPSFSQNSALSASQTAAREQALRYLDQREHSEKEIADKLEARGYPREVAAQTIADLVSCGMLSNRRFAESYAASRRRHGEGDRVIAMRLAEKGIPKDLCDEILADEDGILSVSSADSLKLALSKALRRYKPDDPKLLAYMQRKGFSVRDVRSLL